MSGESLKEQNNNPTQDEWLNLANEVPFAGGEREENEPKFIKLEDLGNICSLDNCVIYGHGTGSAGDGHEVVESIFKEGIKGYESLGNMVGESRDREISGSTDISNQAVGLWASQEGELDSGQLKEKLDHWPHRASENIILMRLPQEYFHMYTNSSAERTEPFYTVHQDASGHQSHYLDNRFILGNYNTKTGMVELNETFEPEITGEFKQELDARLSAAKEKTEARNKALEESDALGRSRNSEPADLPDTDVVNDEDWVDWPDADDNWV